MRATSRLPVAAPAAELSVKYFNTFIHLHWWGNREKMQTQNKHVLFWTRCLHALTAQRMRNGFSAPCVNDASNCILTCRRLASPRAKDLGTGTAGGAGALPFPVRPWFSCLEPRHRYHRKPLLHTEDVDPPKPTPILFLLLFKTVINNKHIDTPHGIVFDLLPK